MLLDRLVLRARRVQVVVPRVLPVAQVQEELMAQQALQGQMVPMESQAQLVRME